MQSASDALGEVIASMMRRDTLDHYRRERDEKIALTDPTCTGHYEGCLEEADEYIRRLRRRGFKVVATQAPAPAGIDDASVERALPWGLFDPEKGVTGDIPAEIVTEYERAAHGTSNLWANGTPAAKQAILVLLCRAWLGGRAALSAAATVSSTPPQAGGVVSAERMFPIMQGPAIPWSLIAPFESQAQDNHGQSLKRLAERGGLSIGEAVAVMTCSRWSKAKEVSVDEFLAFIQKRKALAASPEPPAASPVEGDGWPASRPMNIAPVTERILAIVEDQVRIVMWGKTSHVAFYGWCLADQGAEDFDICAPTGWWPLPNPPATRPSTEAGR